MLEFRDECREAALMRAEWVPKSSLRRRLVTKGVEQISAPEMSSNLESEWESHRLLVSDGVR